MSMGSFLIGLLAAEINVSNLKKLLSFLLDRWNSKPIQLEVEANGKKLKVSARSKEELEAAIIEAQKYIEASENEDNLSKNQLFADFEKEAEYYLKLLDISTRFLQQAGAQVKPRDKRSLFIVKISDSLKLQTPTTVLIAGSYPSKGDVTELVETSKELEREGFRRAGLLLYGESPDPVVRMRIAEARLGADFAIVPIPLAEVENSLQDRRICEAILISYVNRYIQRADFFDDRNAISDTVSFFGRIELLDRLREELLGYQGVGLFGLRKSGKTSILYQLSFLLRKYPVVRVDLQHR